MIHLCLSDIIKLKKLPLGELGFFYGGLSGKSKEDFAEGNGKFVPYMNVFSNFSVNLKDLGEVNVEEGERQNNIKYGDVLFTGSSETPDECGMSSVMLDKVDDETPIYLNSFCFGFRFNDLSLINPVFYKHLFRSNIIRKEISKTANGVTRFNITKKLFAKILIPIPSIEQQSAIAGLLDIFTSLISKLDDEIELRVKQFDYYRDQLLNLEGKCVEKKKLGEIGKCVAGATPSTKVPEYWEGGNIPWMSSGEVHQKIVNHTANFITQEGYENASTKMLPVGTIVIALAGQGKTRGSVAITAIELCTNQSLCGVMISNPQILNKYVYYYMSTRYDDLRRISSGDGTRGGLNLKMISSYSVPIPSLSEQQRIVSTLDTFTSLITKLQEERDLRQKQYEYYCEKLLTFE